jgi:hypothetical protein
MQNKVKQQKRDLMELFPDIPKCKSAGVSGMVLLL